MRFLFNNFIYTIIFALWLSADSRVVFIQHAAVPKGYRKIFYFKKRQISFRAMEEQNHVKALSIDKI